MPLIYLSAHTEYSFAESEPKYFYLETWQSHYWKIYWWIHAKMFWKHCSCLTSCQAQYSGTLYCLVQIHPESRIFLNLLDQGTIKTVHKEIQRPFTNNNILIVGTIITGIPLKYNYLLKGNLGPVLKEVHACCITINPAVFYLEGILIDKIWDNKRCHNIIN